MPSATSSNARGRTSFMVCLLCYVRRLYGVGIFLMEVVLTDQLIIHSASSLQTDYFFVTFAQIRSTAHFLY